MVEDDVQTVRAWLAELALQDPQRRRFGAASHAYHLRAPIDRARLETFAMQHPGAISAWHGRWRCELGDGGVGPFHGLWPLDHPLQAELARGDFDPGAAGRDLYRGVIGLGAVGCGQIAMSVTRGAHAGSVWLDARAVGAGVVEIAPDVETYFAAWIGATTRNELPPSARPADACLLSRALSAHIAHAEARANLAAGSMSRAAMSDELRALPRRSIAMVATGDDPFFAAGTPIAMCSSCAQLAENLGRLGLDEQSLTPGQNWPDFEPVPEPRAST